MLIKCRSCRSCRSACRSLAFCKCMKIKKMPFMPFMPFTFSRARAHFCNAVIFSDGFIYLFFPVRPQNMGGMNGMNGIYN
jgi:hypothetical protein